MRYALLLLLLAAPASAQLPPCNPPQCVSIDQTANPSKSVTGPQEIFLTKPNSDTDIRLHVRPLTAARGPLSERVTHNEYEELRAQHNPMARTSTSSPANAPTTLPLMTQKDALAEGRGKDGKFHTDYKGAPCKNVNCSEWPRKR
jgi:hypothetical protein